jgi:NAD/NADP transhydrogenase alpha subunit
MHLMHRPLVFAQFIGDFVGNITRQQLTDVLYSIGNAVGDCGISSNYFRTLCEMPTDCYPSV